MTEQGETEHRLTCGLGRRVLFSVARRVAVRELSLADVLAGRSPDQLSAAELAAGRDGVLIRCMPDRGTRTLTLEGDRLQYVVAREHWHYLAMAGSFEQYLADRFSEKTRASFERDEGRFVETFGRLDLREYRSPEELQRFALIAAQVVDGRDRMPALGAMRPGDDAFALFADGAPVAFLHLRSAGDTVQYHSAGESEAFRQWSAGSVLHVAVLRRLFADGRFRYLDFMPGDGEIKRQFANGALRCSDILYLRPTLTNHLLLRLHAYLGRCTAWLDGQAGRAGVVGLLHRLFSREARHVG